MPNGDQAPRELTSWKEIAQFLGVSVRSAQRYESEMGLPVRRLGGDKGRAVAADVDHLIAWKKKNVAAPRFWQDPRFLRPYAAVVTGIAFLLAVFVARDLYQALSRGKPQQSYWADSTLVVNDDHGREIWRKKFEEAPFPSSVTHRHHGDLDGDGRVETLVPVTTSQRDAKGAFLHCFSDRGEEIWRIAPRRAVSDRRVKYSDVYVLRWYQVVPSPEKDGTRWVVATFAHHYEFPSVVVVVDGKGTSRGEYWHSGHLDFIHTMDVDNDGREDLLLAGSDIGSSRAVIRVFDPRNVSGASVLPPGHPNQLVGFSPGTEKATILFERSRLNRKWEQFNYAYYISVDPASPNRRFDVSVSENLDRNMGYLVYSIRPDLRLESVIQSHSLIKTYRENSIKDPSSPPFGNADLEELRKGYTVKWGNSLSLAATTEGKTVAEKK